MSAVAEILKHPDMCAVLLAAGWLPPERVAEVEALLSELNSGQVGALHKKPSKGLTISVALTGAALRTLHGKAQGLTPRRVIEVALARNQRNAAKRQADAPPTV